MKLRMMPIGSLWRKTENPRRNGILKRQRRNESIIQYSIFVIISSMDGGCKMGLILLQKSPAVL